MVKWPKGSSFFSLLQLCSPWSGWLSLSLVNSVHPELVPLTLQRRRAPISRSLACPPNVESTGNPSGKVLTCLLFLLLGLSQLEASLWVGGGGGKQMTELASCAAYAAAAPPPPEAETKNCESGLSAWQRL